MIILWEDYTGRCIREMLNALGTQAVCLTILWLNYESELEYISDTLDLRLMGCEIDASS